MVFYTDKIQKAIHFAVKVHQIDRQQTRNDKITPYITHLLSVALILAKVQADENTIVAGILHDTIEDSIASAKITKDIIHKEFGDDIARIVDDVSEKPSELPKMDRKRLAIAHIAKMQQDALLVKTADQLSNLTDILYDMKQKGIKEAFINHESSIEEVRQLYKERIDALYKAWESNPLIPELQLNLDEFLSITS